MVFLFEALVLTWKDLETIHTGAARLIHKLPRNLKDEDVLSIAKWPSPHYFYTFRLLTTTHSAFYHLDLKEINSLG